SCRQFSLRTVRWRDVLRRCLLRRRNLVRARDLCRWHLLDDIRFLLLRPSRRVVGYWPLVSRRFSQAFGPLTRVVVRGALRDANIGFCRVLLGRRLGRLIGRRLLSFKKTKHTLYTIR